MKTETEHENHKRRKMSFLCLLCLLYSVPALIGQEQFTLRVNTRLVVETVSVSHKDGKAIEGLSKDDFILTEDGVPQTIAVFEFEKLDDSTPLRPSAASPSTPTPTG